MPSRPLSADTKAVVKLQTRLAGALGEMKMRAPNGVVVDVLRYRDKLGRPALLAVVPARSLRRRLQDARALG